MNTTTADQNPFIHYICEHCGVQFPTYNAKAAHAGGAECPASHNWKGRPEIGAKLDNGKPRWSLLPFEALAMVVDVLEFGAKKYAPDNWRKVDNAEKRYTDALLRHVAAWLTGEQKDPDSGLHHLAHVACNALFLCAFARSKP